MRTNEARDGIERPLTERERWKDERWAVLGAWLCSFGTLVVGLLVFAFAVKGFVCWLSE